MQYQDRCFQAAVCVPRVSAPILPLQLLMKMVHPKDLLHKGRLLQFSDNPVALRVDVRADMMGHLACCVAQPNPFIERRGAKLHGPVVGEPVPVPESDVMPLARAVADRLLEGQVLLSIEEIKAADWSFVVRPAKD